MSRSSGNRPADNGILREQSLNLPETVTRNNSQTTTPSTLSNSTPQVRFDYDPTTVYDRTSLLALAYMPPTDSDDEADPGRFQRRYRTPAEEEYDHDLNDLADYKGDSGDEAENVDDIYTNVDDAVRESEAAVRVNDENFVACDDIPTDEELRNEHGQANAPPLLPGAPPGWRVPSAPEDWKPDKPNVKLGEPTTRFVSIDNPGGWAQFTYRPKFKHVNRRAIGYMFHALPTGATPVPEADGKRSSSGFDFFYKGWTRNEDDPVFRSGATRDNMFPNSRKGCLGADLLSKFGLTQERMRDNSGAPDALFFYDLILPIHDTSNNGTVEGDPRMRHYPHVAECTQVYAITDLKICGSGRGHHFNETSPQELLPWDGILVFDGVLGGSKGAMLRRWDCRQPDNSSFNKLIHDSMSPSRWLELKRAIKLNNNLTATKRGDPNHDPCQKYDYTYKCICYNTNAITKHASLDLCGDETTWMNASFAEPGSGVISRGLEKPGGSRGGQTVIISDVERVRVRAYVHRHKLHEKHFNIDGCNEIKMISDMLLDMLITDDDDADSTRPKAIFREPPHMTWDNLFSGDQAMEYVASKGMGMTCTVNRGQLPGKVPNQYWHKGTTGSDDRAKSARF